MKTFKIGDRVKTNKGDKGIFLAQHKHEAWVDFDDIGTMTVDLNFLKKLKPKPKREPRRVWVTIRKSDGFIFAAYDHFRTTIDADVECFEFREVLR